MEREREQGRVRQREGGRGMHVVEEREGRMEKTEKERDRRREKGRERKKEGEKTVWLMLNIRHPEL
jgi:hypothetical protein